MLNIAMLSSVGKTEKKNSHLNAHYFCSAAGLPYELP